MISATPTNFVALICIAAVVLVAFWAIRKSRQVTKEDDTLEWFITARNSLPWYQVAWGFHATSMGVMHIINNKAWVVFGISAYAIGNGAGIVGLVVYSAFTGVRRIITLDTYYFDCSRGEGY